MHQEVAIYTDGACSGNPGVGGWGAVLICGTHKKELYGAEPNTTSNRMELTAVIKALSALKHNCIVTIYSDSAYVVNAFNCGWIAAWRQSNWKNSSKKPVQNKDLWTQLIELIEMHSVRFVKVKGHADNKYNNRCDKLATDAIKYWKNIR